MKRILVVEDDLNIAKLIKDTLELENYDIECVFNGTEALQTIKKDNFDLIILDIMLPGLDGFEIISNLPDKCNSVIFLSAINDINTIVKGLKIGAQDYMVKPFEPLELLARVELRLKNKIKTQDTYKYKNIEIKVLERVVYKENTRINLTPKEFDLLLLLINNIGIALTRDEILNKVWDIDQEIETRTVDYHIQQLRKKLELKKEIVTVSKIGYRLERYNEI